MEIVRLELEDENLQRVTLIDGADFLQVFQAFDSGEIVLLANVPSDRPAATFEIQIRDIDSSVEAIKADRVFVPVPFLNGRICEVRIAKLSHVEA